MTEPFVGNGKLNGGDMRDEVVRQLKTVLIRQVGDHRYCPRCGEGFIPKDPTAKMAWEIYKKLFPPTDNKRNRAKRYVIYKKMSDCIKKLWRLIE